MILLSLVSISTEAVTLLPNEFMVLDEKVRDGLQSSELLFGHKDF